MARTTGVALGALVIDDEPQIGRAVQRCLEAASIAVTIASTGEDGLAMAAASQPDLVILDLGLPDLSGIEVIERLRSWTDAPIIVLSGSGDESTKVKALQVGADDFVTKPFSTAELVARAEAALRRAGGAAVKADAVRRYEDLEVDLSSLQVRLGGAVVRLTRTEYALLEAFVTNPGKLLTHWWLLDRVWGRGVGQEGRQYLRVYTGQLRSKLRDPATSPRFILTEPGVGYRWIAAPLDDEAPNT